MTEKWMTCTTCKAIVQLNATGICLGCQMGFVGQQETDKYMLVETKLKEKELEDALKERKESENNIKEHKNRNRGGKTTETSRSHSSKRSGKEASKKGKKE